MSSEAVMINVVPPPPAPGAPAEPILVDPSVSEIEIPLGNYDPSFNYWIRIGEELRELSKYGAEAVFMVNGAEVRFSLVVVHGQYIKISNVHQLAAGEYRFE